MNFRGNKLAKINGSFVQLCKQLVNTLAGFVAVLPANDWTAEPDGCQITPALNSVDLTWRADRNRAFRNRCVTSFTVFMMMRLVISGLAALIALSQTATA